MTETAKPPMTDAAGLALARSMQDRVCGDPQGLLNELTTRRVLRGVQSHVAAAADSLRTFPGPEEAPMDIDFADPESVHRGVAEVRDRLDESRERLRRLVADLDASLHMHRAGFEEWRRQ